MDEALHDLAGKLAEVDREMEALEGHLDGLRRERKELVTHDLPEALRRAHQTRATVLVGNREYEVALKHKIVGTLSRAPDVDVGLKYLRDKGFPGAADATITVKTSEADADYLADHIRDAADDDVAIKVERKVNHMTLAAFARECLATGDGFDLDVVGLTALTEATLKEKG